jgi:hypothetical protein
VRKEVIEMIKTESEYFAMVERLNKDIEFMDKQKAVLVEMGLSADEVELKRKIAEAKLRQKRIADERQEMGVYRRVDKKTE